MQLQNTHSARSGSPENRAMVRKARSGDLAALRRRWRKWTAMVELFARRRRRRRRVSFADYCRVHGELIAACKSLAESSEPAQRAFYEELAALAEPWMTPNVLARAERDIMFDLLLRCREAEHKLGGRAWSSVAPDLPGRVVLPLAIAAALLAVSW